MSKPKSPFDQMSEGDVPDVVASSPAGNHRLSPWSPRTSELVSACDPDGTCHLFSEYLAPLLPPADSDAPQPTSETYEAQQCLWALGHRVPQLIDFDADPYWPKRAAGLSFFKVHLVLFLSPPHADLARAVDRAIRTFSRGDVVGFMHTLHDFDAPNAMFTRHGVNTVLDTPKLIVRDQRLAPDDRQIPYKGEISEEAIVAFLRSLTPPLVPEGETPPAPAKDEL